MLAESEIVFDVRDATYRYQGRHSALDGATLRIRRGERVALLGANGCGKSTMLKVLDGLIFVDDGTVTAFGDDLTPTQLDNRSFSQLFRSRVGFVFQNSDAQVFSPSVRDEIAFGPLHMGLDPGEVAERVRDTLTMLEIGHLEDRAPHQLSGGQKKRVAIASVLAMNPEVLLFDEPTAALDPRTQHWLIELIEELHASGRTIVVATHDLATLPELVDHCFVFGEDHRIASSGPTDAVLDDTALLRSVNLVHEHSHRHGTVEHAHEHSHDHHAVHRSDPI